MKDFSIPNRIEESYRRSFKGLIDKFIEIILPSITDPFQFLQAFRDFTSTEYFQHFTYSMASRMVTGVMVENAQSWREAARKSMNGRMIYETLRREMEGPVGIRIQELINDNARLISTFPDDIAELVANFIKDESEKGIRADRIAKTLIKQFPEVTRGRINLISRTETSKAGAALTRARSEELGLDWYQWMTSKDVRVRPSHKNLEGVVIAWSDPPAPDLLLNIKSTLGHAHAGEFPNCRCYSAPLISLDDITWPHKVYSTGRIRYMTRANFERLANIQLRKAA